MGETPPKDIVTAHAVPAPAKRAGFLRRLAPRRVVRDERGSAAVEFGIIALPFFALIFAILETALAFFAHQLLESAVSDASRLIRTGQAQQQSFDADRFRKEICDRLVVLYSNCGSKLKLDVRVYNNFNAADTSKPIDGSGNANINEQYDDGQASQIVVVKAYYEWPTLVTGFGLNLSDLANGNRLLGAVTAFRNEPFPW